jgi:glucose-6-phosphate isomerase, archaeal
MNPTQGADLPSSTPFRAVVEADGRLEPATSGVQRRLSDMRGFYADAAAEEALAGDDPVVYEVFQYDVPEAIGELFTCTTVLHPGRVGDEYFMTKGHYHEVRDRAEVYYGLSGHGRLLLQTESGEFESTEMEPGTVAYVPPGWGHRTVNTGDEDFVFLAVYPGDAGHDYGAIETTGFARRLVDRDGTPTLVANEEFHR